MSVYLKLYKIQYHSWILSMSSRTMDLRPTVRYQEYTAKLLKITQVHSNWQDFQSYVHVPNTSISSTITFVSMSDWD
jgi:hypothetical protein